MAGVARPALHRRDPHAIGDESVLGTTLEVARTDEVQEVTTNETALLTTPQWWEPLCFEVIDGMWVARYQGEPVEVPSR